MANVAYLSIPKSYLKLKVRLKELTGRSNGMGYEQRKSKLHLFIRSWIEYFQLADMQSYLKRIDEWLRRRIRMCIWKYWKKVKTRFANLQKCGISKFYAATCQYSLRVLVYSWEQNPNFCHG